MDATPLTLGQEFSAYAAQLDFGLRALRNTLPHSKPISAWWYCSGYWFKYTKGL